MNVSKIALPTTVLIALSTFFLFFHSSFHASKPQPFHVGGKLSAVAHDIFGALNQPDIITLKEANTYAQKYFIRKGERWVVQEDTPERQLMQEKREKLMHDLQQLGMVSEILPQKKHYTYAGLMGALKERVELRLAFLQKLVDQGLTFDYLVLLGGMRELQDFERKDLPENVTQELDMMRYLIENSSLKNHKIIEVNAPMVQKTDGTLVRPNTDDTVMHFVKIAPEEGTFLVVSNNPFIQRQTKVAQRLLDQKKFPTDGTGPALDADEADIIIIMDEFARTLNEEFKAEKAASAA